MQESRQRLKCFPDIAWTIMESALTGIKDADIYIDDAGVLFNDWNHHVQLLAIILCHFGEN